VCITCVKSEVCASDFFMRYLFLFICSFCAVVATPQVKKQGVLGKIFGKITYDSNYVKSYYDALHITVVAIQRNHDIEIFDRSTRSQLNFKPNNSFNYGFGLDWKFLTIELSRSIPYLSVKDERKGATESFTARFGLTGKKFLASALVQVYQGMYISNPQQVFPNWNVEKDGYPLRNDISSVVVFGSMYYNFNASRFSLMSSLWQLDRQLKSAGGWLTGLTLNANSIVSDTAIAPGNQVLTIDPSQKINQSSNVLIGANAGYGYTYVWGKNIFASGLLMPGLNVQSASVVLTDGSQNTFNTQIGLHGDLRIIAGYNGSKWYTGVHYANYFIQNRISESVEINLFNSYLRLFIGKRFDVSRRKKVD
jgi:hypothetical protein